MARTRDSGWPQRDHAGGAQRPDKGKGKQRVHHNPRTERRQQDEHDLEALERAVEAFDVSKPPTLFSDLPVSKATLQGLRFASYTTLTPIQALALPLALKGRDVLGAARTGSGKTLAFVVPLLERLFRQKWGPHDGLGAVVISPTRELAVQIFDVLKKVGVGHSFSAGLVIGGKSLEEERDRLARMNILVATPGRLQQHMQQTSDFNADNLQMLVLDEADRILDLGFSKSLNAIVSHLPAERQTLLFSATQTKSVKDLARLSLDEPEYVAAREAGVTRDLTTPVGLTQHYMVVPLEEKLDYLWTFVRTHLKAKTIVFLSSCKQVRFVFECFRHLRPGIPVLHLHGKQKQSKRLEIYRRFASSPAMCLFATDVAARGLDFPAVTWVVQADCPEDVDTYVHRVGRTARYQSSGRALTFLLPSESPAMSRRWEERGIEVQNIRPNEAKKQTLEKKLQSLMFRFPELKHLGQRAFVSYVRSVHLQKDKEVFKLDAMPLEAYAASLGLPGAPRLRFAGDASGQASKERKNRERDVDVLRKKLATGDDSTSSSGSEAEEEEEEEAPKKKKAVEKKDKAPVRTKYDRMRQRTNQDVLSAHYAKTLDPSKPDDDDDFLTLKRADHDLDASTVPPLDDLEEQNLSKRKQRLALSKKAMAAKGPKGTKMVFDEDGVARPIYELKTEEEFKREGEANEQARKWAEGERKVVEMGDVRDREVEKEKRAEKKRKRKGRAQQEREDGVAAVVVGGGDHVMPDFDLDDHADADEDAPAVRKKRKQGRQVDDDDLEARALKALAG